jgi:hypothetical protein
MNNPIHWKYVVDKKKTTRLIFIHTPKCAGTYAGKIIDDLNIYNKHHTLADEGEGINFTIIRDPVDRFESLLNYRLDEPTPRYDWPIHLYYVYNYSSINLNEIVSQMSDYEIVSFRPYNSLVYWSKNIDIFITIDQLQEFLNFFGYNYDKDKYSKQNVSNKLRGKFNDETRSRIKQLYNDDVLLFNSVIQ